MYFEKGDELEIRPKSVGEMQVRGNKQGIGCQRTERAVCDLKESQKLSFPGSLSTKAIIPFWVLQAICS